MKRLLLAVLALNVLACKPTEEKAAAPSPSPAPTASAPMSLAEALPSALPSTVLPSMPPPTAGRFVFFDDFENGTAKWQVDEGKGGLGWHHIKSKSCGGLYTMVLGTPHNDPFKSDAFKGGQVTAYLGTAKPIDLKGAHKPQLQFDLKGYTTPKEVLTIQPEVRPAGGAWQPVGAPATAQFPVVVTFTADLTPYAGQAVDLRFKGTIKGNDQPNKGVFLDDVHVVEPNQ
jgi:hypothetical protein